MSAPAPRPGGPTPPSARKVQDALAARGFANRVVEFAHPTRSAADAARALGCTVAQIAKSLVFRRTGTGAPVLVIASGANRVDEHRVGALLGEPIGKGDADFVREATGFAIGGVAPIGHAHAIETLLDEDLLTFDEIWAAGGHPNTVFKLTPDELVRRTGGRVVAVK
jgi:prolyl-tRNA editing enzyme YbaK/EbsC (Cys-tRNA(Pro) deacylase)